MSTPYRKLHMASSALDIKASVLSLLLQALARQQWEKADDFLSRYPSALVRRIEAAPLNGCTLLERFADSTGFPELYEFLLTRGAAWKVSGSIQFLTRSSGAVSENLVKNNRVDLLEVLVRHCGPEVLDVFSDGASLLHTAINYRSGDAFGWILARAPHLMDHTDKKGRTPAQMHRAHNGSTGQLQADFEQIGQYIRSWEVTQEARSVLDTPNEPELANARRTP